MGVAVPRRQAPIPGGVQLDLSASGQREAGPAPPGTEGGLPAFGTPPPKPNARPEVLGPCEVCIQVSRTATTTGDQVITAGLSAAIAIGAGWTPQLALLRHPHWVDAVPVRADGASGSTDRLLSPGDGVPRPVDRSRPLPGVHAAWFPTYEALRVFDSSLLESAPTRGGVGLGAAVMDGGTGQRADRADEAVPETAGDEGSGIDAAMPPHPWGGESGSESCCSRFRARQLKRTLRFRGVRTRRDRPG